MEHILSLCGKQSARTRKYSPKVASTRRHRVASNALQLAPPMSNVTPDSDSDAYRKKTLNLRKWLADLLLCLLLRREDGDPLPPSCPDLNSITALSYNIFEFLWHGSNTYNSPDKLAFVAMHYAIQILPNGLLKSTTLYTPNGITVATRLFAVTFSLAAKCFQDEELKNFFKSASLLRSNLSPYSALSLELAIVEALSSRARFDLFLTNDVWVRHLRSLFTWTRGRERLDAAYQVISERLHELIEASKHSTSSGYFDCVRTQGPLTMMSKVISILLVDLNL